MQAYQRNQKKSKTSSTETNQGDDIDLDWLEYYYCTILRRSEYDFWTSDLRKTFAQIDIYTSMNEKQQEARKKVEEENNLKKEGKQKTTYKVLD